MMARLLRLFHTVRHLRWEQVIYRLHNRFSRGRVRVGETPAHRTDFPAFGHVGFAAPSLIAPETFSFLGETERVSLEDWAAPHASLLWRYNLHYFDDLNAKNAEDRFTEHCELVDSWIDVCRSTDDVGWAPYPSSLRIVNWVKWLSQHPEQATEKVLLSLAQQTDLLEQRIEYHLLGNHLFENAKALLICGAYLVGEDADRWLSRGLRLVNRELREQFLGDGGHFERSPMYHATMLWDILDLIEVSREEPTKGLHGYAENWSEVFRNGFRWLETMSFPDGEIAFFNDSAFDIAPNCEALRVRARHLAVSIEPAPRNSVIDLADTGYARVSWSDAVLIADMAPLGPDYLPGHAHADTLSFEMAVDGERLFVNSGTSCYGLSAERERQRGTSAHNTVEVDGENSSETWAGFRVARRAYPIGRAVAAGVEGPVLSCSHTGYLRLSGKVLHTRRWLCRDSLLVIEDRLDGKFAEAKAHFLVHPSWKFVSESGGAIQLQHFNGRIVHISVDGGRLHSESATWHPRFGQAIPTIRLVTQLDRAAVTHHIKW